MSMYKIYLINKKLSDSFFSLLVIILITFFNQVNVVYGANNKWFEVSKTPVGIQYLDIDSINKKNKGIIEISTKYLKIDANNSKEIEKNIYRMKINCVTNKFKDISVNGKKNLGAKWEDPNGDKLINDVITESCKNV
tara:strand:+ start:494 stop:904 length:411 start_codon:yes stop_codon:yes gene_type:complete